MESNYWLRQRAFSRRRLLGTAGASAAGLAAAITVGCGDDDGKTPSATTAATARPSAATTASAGAGSPAAAGSPTAAAEQPIRGGTLQSWRVDNFIRENLTFASGPAQEFVGLVYSPLLAPKTARKWQDAYGYTVRPDLAKSYEQPDQTTYTFKLEPEAKFQPKAPTNGRAVSSDDVIASLDRFINEPKNTQRADYVKLIDSYKAIDANTVQIKTKTPYAPFILHLITFQLFRVYPKELIADDNLRTNDPNGSGPFVLKEFKPDSFWDFTANPTHHVKDEAGQKRPYVDALRFNVIADRAQQIVQFNAGRIDQNYITPYTMLQQVQGQVKGLDIIEAYGTTYTTFMTQQRGGPFKDMRLRQGISMAVDRTALLAIQGNPGSYCNYVGPNMGKWFLDPQGSDAGPNAQYFKYNLADAKKAFDAGGLTGQTINFIYTNGYGQQHIDEALVIADQLQKAGLKLSVQMQDYQTKFLPGAGKGSWGGGDFDGIIFGLRGGYPHPYQTFNLNLYSKGTFNTGGWNDPDLDGMIDKLGAEFNDAQQLKLSNDIQRYAMEKQYWSPAITNLVYSIAQPWVKNHQLNNLYQRDAEAVMWFKDKKA